MRHRFCADLIILSSKGPFRSRPSSLTAGIRVPDIAIVFSYVHPKAEAEGSESKSTGSEKKAIRSQSIWLAAEFKVYELLRNGLPSNPSSANSRSKVCLGQCLMHLDAGYQMFRLLRALAVCGTRFARVWTLSNRPGGRTFAVETSRPLGNNDPMGAADFLTKSISTSFLTISSFHHLPRTVLPSITRNVNFSSALCLVFVTVSFRILSNQLSNPAMKALLTMAQRPIRLPSQPNFFAMLKSLLAKLVPHSRRGERGKRK